MDAKLKSSLEGGDIREHLKLWQEQQDLLPDSLGATKLPHISRPKTGQNLFTQSSEDQSLTTVTPEVKAEEIEDEDYVDFGSDEPTPDVLRNEMFLRRGDLVELTQVLLWS